MSTIEVVLLKDVEVLGKEGAVVPVKTGFARNYLLPRGWAVLARPEVVKAVEARKQHAQRKQERIHEQAEALKRSLESRSLTIKLALGEQDKAFGSITTHDIVQALAQEGFTVDKHAVHLEEPIKALGIYEVPVRLHAEVTATVKLWVVKA